MIAMLAFCADALVSDESLSSVLLRSVFVENILLSFFLGMCSYLAVSKRVDSAIGLGIAVIFVQVLTVPMNWVLQTYVLSEGALAWAGFPDSDLGYLQFLTFIASIAAVTQVVEMAVDKFSAILGGSLFMVERKYDFAQAVTYGFGSGAGWALAIVSMAAIRWRMRTANIPAPLKGLGITFITTGLVAMAFMTFSGI